MEEGNEIVFTSIEELKSFLHDNANADTIVSVTIDTDENIPPEEGGD